MSARRNTTLAARLWWATLPYAGWVGYREKELEADGTCQKPPWWAWPLAWLNTFASKLPGSDPFEPMAPVICSCDFCLGLTDEWTP